MEVDVVEEVDLGTVIVVEDEAHRFAAEYDPNPVHLWPTGNEVLPAGTVSGIYVLSLINERLTGHPSFGRVICANRMHVWWLRPVLENDELTLTGHFAESWLHAPDCDLDLDCTCAARGTRDATIEAHVEGELRVRMKMRQLIRRSE